MACPPSILEEHPFGPKPSQCCKPSRRRLSAAHHKEIDHDQALPHLPQAIASTNEDLPFCSDRCHRRSALESSTSTSDCLACYAYTAAKQFQDIPPEPHVQARKSPPPTRIKAHGLHMARVSLTHELTRNCSNPRVGFSPKVSQSCLRRTFRYPSTSPIEYPKAVPGP
jgi:hypothetical protein